MTAFEDVHVERAEALENLQHALIICDENLCQAAEKRLKKAVPQLGIDLELAANVVHNTYGVRQFFEAEVAKNPEVTILETIESLLQTHQDVHAMHYADLLALLAILTYSPLLYPVKNLLHPAAEFNPLPGELIERIEANRADPSRLIKRQDKHQSEM